MRVADPAQAWFEAAIAAFGFGVDPTVVAVGLGLAALALALWIAWRWPALMLALGLASLALRPQLLWGDRNVGYEWGLHQTLLVVGLAANALHFGVRKSINWPILALIVVLGLNLLFGHLHDDLTTGLMVTGLSLLALPFAFTHVILAPDSRGVCALVIALTPLLSVVIGALIQAAGIHTMFADVHDRLEGATGNAGVFGALAFAGFAVALHESAVRPKGRSWMGALASVNLVLVILSGTRTSMLASAVLLLTYVLTSEQFREEVVQEAQRKSKAPEPVCSDQITTEVTMGSLSMSRTEPCGKTFEPAPAFDEILSILAPAMQGNFDGPVDTAEPRLLPMRLERLQVQDQPAYTIKIDAAARAMITTAGRSSERHELSIQQRDTIRLLQARIIDEPVVPCMSTAYYQLHVDTEPAVSGPDCGFPQRQPEFRALTVLLETAFGV